MYTVLNYIRPFEGNRETDVAPSENEFDTPALQVHIGTHCKLSQTKQKAMEGKQRHRSTKLRLGVQTPEE